MALNESERMLIEAVEKDLMASIGLDAHTYDDSVAPYARAGVEDKFRLRMADSNAYESAVRAFSKVHERYDVGDPRFAKQMTDEMKATGMSEDDMRSSLEALKEIARTEADEPHAGMDKKLKDVRDTMPKRYSDDFKVISTPLNKPNVKSKPGDASMVDGEGKSTKLKL